MALFKKKPTPSYLTAEDMEDFARGAAFLGTGGGGDPYIGKLLAQNAIGEFGAPKIIDVSDLDDHDAVFPIAMIGAPTVIIEKAVSGEDADRVLEKMEELTGRKASAIIPAEIGGINATLPVMMAARRGLPIVDGDGMGRAFPEIHMVTFNVKGVSATPLVVVNEHLESVVIETNSAQEAEKLVRSVIIQMGLAVMSSLYPMTGAQVKQSAVSKTLTTALEIGRAIAQGRVEGDPLEALLGYLRSSPYYNQCRVLFDGKITDLRRETTGGFAIGHCILQEVHGKKKMELVFQNEFLRAQVDGRTLAIVPDLICVIDRENAEPITTEALKYGQRVKVLGVSAAPIMREDDSLAVFGPHAFGFDEPFKRVEELNDA